MLRASASPAPVVLIAQVLVQVGWMLELGVPTGDCSSRMARPAAAAGQVAWGQEAQAGQAASEACPALRRVGAVQRLNKELGMVAREGEHCSTTFNRSWKKSHWTGEYSLSEAALPALERLGTFQIWGYRLDCMFALAFFRFPNDTHTAFC